MDTIVTGCGDCPMFSMHIDWNTESNCGHPLFEGKGVVEEITVIDGNPITPDNCPLKKEPITISKQ